MKLKVHTSDRSTVYVEVKPKEEIWRVKQKISEKTGDHWYDYSLFYNNTYLHADQKVSRCGLSNGSVVLWRRMLWIFVVTERGEKIQLLVWLDATVSVVKMMVEETTGILVTHLTLTFMGEELSDEYTLKKCGVEHHDELRLITRKNISQHSSLHRLQQQMTTVERTQREQHEVMREMCRELYEKNQQMEARVAKMEQKMAAMAVQAPLQARTESRTYYIPPAARSLRQKFKKNFNAFLDVDLNIADRLYQTSVLTRDRYEYIFDRNTSMSTRDRMREMLKDVMKSESNIRAFRQALVEAGDDTSMELAALLQ